jgi:hypothetical protein
MQRRLLITATAAATLAALGGCAALNTVSSEISSYGQWPQGRAPGRYFIEELPSQAARRRPGGVQATLEEAAHRALQGSGFTRAATLGEADVVVQVGARITVYDPSPWADPLWWRWGTRYWRAPGWSAPGWGIGPRSSFYWRPPPPPEREVAILLRDRAGSLPLWEARAISSGSATDVQTLQAMLTAAMTDFPNANPESRRVSVPLQRSGG